MAEVTRETIQNTELYKLMEKRLKDEKAVDKSHFLTAVEDLCMTGEGLSTQTFSFFPTFTRHDQVHILGVCAWMHRLLDSMNGLETLTAEEAALLLLAAFWHDSGMAVTPDQKTALLDGMERGAGDWNTYFSERPGDAVALAEAEDEAARTEVKERILRNYVRERHAKRCAEQLPTGDVWTALESRGIYRDTVIAVCASHGEWMEDLSLGNDEYEFDLRLCAVLLRLADLLDYDASRAPKNLFHFLGLDKPETEEEKKSREEWNQNSNFGFQKKIQNHKIIYRATFTDSQTSHGVRSYLKWVNQELTACQTYLEHSENERWRQHRLPDRVEDKSRCIGFEEGDFQITMDQDGVLNLLVGENLYGDPGVFVRELLQNAIDAVLERAKRDSTFDKADGRVTVRCWRDREGYGWFRIEDNGIGMDEHIIKDYFLRVGRSYYDSNEYRAAALHPVKETGDKPISRFGIGVLSCFMTDPDSTTLKVSTRRYDAPAPLRLDVTGLHGFYTLTKVDSSHPGKPITAPPYWKNEARSEPGTTVCVRVNLFKLGHASFRELMDSYVVFPEIPVTYYDEQTPNGYTYPTQWELMDAVHALCGEETKKTIAFLLSDALFDRVKRYTPPWSWNDRPAVTLTFRPLDGLLDDMSGVIVNAGFAGDAVYDESVEYKGKTWRPKAALDVSVNAAAREITLNIVPVFGVVDSDTRQKIRSRFRHSLEHMHVWFSYDELLFLSPDDIQCALRPVLDAVRGSGDTRSVAAYNGMVADRNSFLVIYRSNLAAVLLLRGDARPEVSLARGEISALPLDVLCALTLRDFDSSSRFPEERFALRSERDWLAVLERHPDWGNELRLDGRTLDELEAEARKSGEYSVGYSLITGKPTDHLLLAALRRRFTVSADGGTLHLRPCAAPPEPSPLPVVLLLAPASATDALAKLAKTVRSGVFLFFSAYNPNHPFFRWLVEQQPRLQKELPALYNGLLKAMVLGNDADDMRRELNDALDRLRQFPDNPYRVPTDLTLTEADFIVDYILNGD